MTFICHIDTEHRIHRVGRLDMLFSLGYRKYLAKFVLACLCRYAHGIIGCGTTYPLCGKNTSSDRRVTLINKTCFLFSWILFFLIPFYAEHQVCTLSFKMGRLHVSIQVLYEGEGVGQLMRFTTPTWLNLPPGLVSLVSAERAKCKGG